MINHTVSSQSFYWQLRPFVSSFGNQILAQYVCIQTILTVYYKFNYPKLGTSTKL